jgi:hypothetical protein
MVWEKTGLPVMNGDHSFGHPNEHQTQVKGIQVESVEAMGTEYAKYLKGIMSLPWMVGWQHCGYLEMWSGTTDATGKQQNGFFSPFGEPTMAALQHVKPANDSAVYWHGGPLPGEETFITGPITSENLKSFISCDAATRHLVINNPEIFNTVSIRNVRGDIVGFHDLTGSTNHLNINTLIPGLYFISLTGPEKSYSIRILKQ